MKRSGSDVQILQMYLYRVRALADKGRYQLLGLPYEKRNAL